MRRELNPIVSVPIHEWFVTKLEVSANVAGDVLWMEPLLNPGVNSLSE